MMSGVSLETCRAIKKHWNNKFYYTSHFVGCFCEICIMMHVSMNIKFGRISLLLSENLV